MILDLDQMNSVTGLPVVLSLAVLSFSALVYTAPLPFLYTSCPSAATVCLLGDFVHDRTFGVDNVVSSRKCYVSRQMHRRLLNAVY